VSRQGTGRHIADTAVRASIAPRPAKAVVEQSEWFPGRELTQDRRIGRRRIAQRRGRANLARQGLGVMGRNYPACQRDIGQILAIGIELRFREVRRAGKNELVSSGGRRPGLGR
jgi:hypothetical protein